MKTRGCIVGVGLLVAGLFAGCADSSEPVSQVSTPAKTGATITPASTESTSEPMPDPNAKTADKIVRSDEEWKQILTPEQYRVMRQQGTERAFTGEYAKTHTPGTYVCAACGQELFDSETKFESGTGWPSFYAPIAREKVGEQTDTTHGMARTEVHCSRCGGHLGHVFPDGPKPTGLRYCLNSVSLKLVPEGSPETPSK